MTIASGLSIQGDSIKLPVPTRNNLRVFRTQSFMRLRLRLCCQQLLQKLCIQWLQYRRHRRWRCCWLHLCRPREFPTGKKSSGKSCSTKKIEEANLKPQTSNWIQLILWWSHSELSLLPRCPDSIQIKWWHPNLQLILWLLKQNKQKKKRPLFGYSPQVRTRRCPPHGPRPPPGAKRLIKRWDFLIHFLAVLQRIRFRDYSGRFLYWCCSGSVLCLAAPQKNHQTSHHLQGKGMKR